MTTETSQEGGEQPIEIAGESEQESGGEEAELISIPKSEWEKANQTLGSLKREIKDLKKPKEVPKETPPSNTKTGELDEAQLDFFELKGYSDPDEIAVFQKIMRNTGMSHREVLKDEYAMAKVKAIQQEREVKNATPSSSRRGGNQQNDIASALAKFEQTGELPTDFALRSAVINAKVDKSNTNKPAWH